MYLASTESELPGSAEKVCGGEGAGAELAAGQVEPHQLLLELLHHLAGEP